MTVFRQRWKLALMLVAAAVCLPGCDSGGHFTLLGYTTEPPFDQSIRSVYVPIAKNTTYLKDIEFDLTQQIIKELNMRAGAPRVTSERCRADSELLVKIVNVKKNTFLLNQLGETRDSELTIQIEVIWRDLRPGHIGDVLSNPKRYDPNMQPLPGETIPPPPKDVPIVITPATHFAPELGGSFLTAQRQLTTRAAMQIVNMMETWPRSDR
jgi:hypothetical protein